MAGVQSSCPGEKWDPSSAFLTSRILALAAPAFYYLLWTTGPRHRITRPPASAFDERERPYPMAYSCRNMYYSKYRLM